MVRIWNPPGQIAADYWGSDAPVRCIQGPIESGKSVASCMALFRAMCETPRSKGSNLRKSRWLVSRNTYADLRNSTVNTFLDWFPPGPRGKGFGKFYETEPYEYKFIWRDIEAEIHFESFQDDSDTSLRALKSKEYTGGWFNEAQFSTRKLIAAMIERTGRYPKWEDISHSWQPGGEKWEEMKSIRRARAVKEFRAGLRGDMNPGPMPPFEEMRIDRRWFIMDMNAPRVSNHWIQIVRGDIPVPDSWDESEKRAHKKPENWAFFMQPPAVFPDAAAPEGYVINPKAENLRNMAPGRYLDLCEGRSTKEIDRELRNKVVIEARGEPVFPGFRRDVHVTRDTIRPHEGGVVYGGADFGLTPAWVFGQRVGRRWPILREMSATNKTASEYAPEVAKNIAKWFPWVVTETYTDEHGEEKYRFDPSLLRLWGDPSGGWSGQAHRQSVFDVYRTHNLIVRAPAIQDVPALRIDLTRNVISRFEDGEPVLMVDPGCSSLIAALDGGYTLKRLPGTKTNEIVESVNKDGFSHIGEALQYMFWGAGEAKVVTGRAAEAGLGGLPVRVNVRDMRDARTKTSVGILAGNKHKGALFRFSRGSK